VPSAEEVQRPTDEDKPGRRTRALVLEQQRRRIQELAELLPARELDAAVAFLEFLRERKHLPRARARDAGPGPESEGAPAAQTESDGD
jgi:hypothetical protein